MKQIVTLFRPRREQIILFSDLVTAATKEEAGIQAISQFWEDMPKGWSPISRLRNRLPDGLYLDSAPLYIRDIERGWQRILASMRSFHEMRDAFAKLGVIRTHASEANRRINIKRK